MFNMDKTGLSIVHKPGRVVAEFGRRNVWAITSAEKGRTHTVLTCVSKKSTIELHIKSIKHTKGKERLILKDKRQLDIVASLRVYDKEVQSSGETLPDTTRVYRVNDVTALLKAGIPLSKLDILRDVLEENAYSLSDSSHLDAL